ncbi:MAG: PQQ-binding-like beta-propeller repeat protein [Verrucomicrobiota bacterium]
MKTTLTLFFCFVSVSFAENWAYWRGPNMDGSSSESGLPEKFSQTENVKWSMDMPSPSASVPIVWEDRVFVSYADPDESGDFDKGDLVAMCLDRETGEVLWRDVAGTGYAKDDRSNFSAPSPTTNGEVVVFFYGSGELVAYDLEGKRLWDTNVQDEYGEFAFGWTFSSSPLLHGEVLYFQLLQRDVQANGYGAPDGNESFLLGMDAKTGKVLWKVERPSDAIEESREAFSSPVIFENDGEEQLLVVGGDCLTAHDPGTGKELWRWGTWNPGHREGFWRLVPSPVGGGGVILACAPKKQPVYAVKEGLSGDYTGKDDALAWVSEDKEISTDVATPLYYEGRFYVLNSNGPKKYLNCIDPATGEVIYREMIPAKGKIEASPTGADGKIYLMSFLGEVFVVKAGDAFELLHETVMGGRNCTMARSSIAAAQGNLFIRTDGKLYCVGE